ncbi:cystin-1 [Suncus etruscus]|uniref:cystin-1 n=1 Tax=Suncus etruscus TaxID=109475 RepID=UPI002110C1BC|nr:cystin-1 [Suncus etruscus]
MGSGSSRALRRLRGSDSRPAGCSGGAPESGTAPEETREAAGGSDPGPTAPQDSRDETLRLLDELLAESAAWGSGERTPRSQARPLCAGGIGSPVSDGSGCPRTASIGSPNPGSPPAPRVLLCTRRTVSWP